MCAIPDAAFTLLGLPLALLLAANLAQPAGIGRGGQLHVYIGPSCWPCCQNQ